MELSRNLVIHRDLKPANILLNDGECKIADFGFCTFADSVEKSGYNVGTPLYMSPEALKANIYSFKSDVWAIGIIFYEMLHGFINIYKRQDPLDSQK